MSNFRMVFSLFGLSSGVGLLDVTRKRWRVFYTEKFLRTRAIALRTYHRPLVSRSADWNFSQWHRREAKIH